MIAVAERERVLVGGVRARLRLRQREAADLVARRDRLEELLPLRVVAVLSDRVAEERVVHGHHDGVRSAHARDLLHRDGVRDRIAAHAAPLLGRENAHEAQLAHPLDGLVGKTSIAVDLGGDGADFALGEVARHLADHPLLVGEIEVHFSRSFLNSWVSAGTTSKRSPTIP